MSTFNYFLYLLRVGVARNIFILGSVWGGFVTILGSVWGGFVTILVQFGEVS